MTEANLIQEAIESVKGTLIEEMIAVSISGAHISFSLAKCIDHSYTIANFSSSWFYFPATVWYFLQHHVINRYCLGNRCSGG